MSRILPIFFIYLISSPALYSEEKPQISVSIQPLYLIFQQLVGDDFKIHRIAPPGSSPHTYEPSPQAQTKLNESVKVFYVSEHLDHWVTKLGSQEPIAVIQLVPRSERLLATAHHHHGEGEAHRHHGPVVDPHFWMNPETVSKSLKAIQKELCNLQTEACPRIEKRREEMEAQLEQLDQDLRESFKAFEGRSVITAHDFLAYFARRYRLRYEQPVEPIPGKEPSPRDIIRLIGLVKDRSIRVIFSEPQLSQRAVLSIAREANIEVEILDPIGVDPSIKSYRDLIEFNAKRILGSLKK